MNTPRSSRPLGPALSLALVVLLGACAQNPAATDAAGTPGAAEPPPPLGASAAAPTPPATAPTAASEAVAVRPDRPETYTVAPGDTLWSIAARFLKKPWQWREIWRQNPQLRNPNRIYPGDVLRFSYTADGQPQLQVAEREDVPLLKLSPQVRAEALTQPIPPVPRDSSAAIPLPASPTTSLANWIAMSPSNSRKRERASGSSSTSRIFSGWYCGMAG